MKNNILFVILGVIIGTLWMQNRKLSVQTTSLDLTSRKSRTAEEISPTYKAWKDNFELHKSNPPMPHPQLFSKTYHQMLREFMQLDLTETETENVRSALANVMGVMALDIEQIVEKYGIPVWEGSHD